MIRKILLATVLLASAQAHMKLHHPPPFGADNNPHRTDPADPFLDYPFNCCGRQTVYPCRGYLRLVGTNQGKPVASWPAGSVQSFSLTGKGTHYGGSCQAGFSIDKGKTWKVVTSYEGNCPHRKGSSTDPSQQTFKLTVPSDMPSGDHIFAWTWFNREQEFYMNCSPVTITGGSGIPRPGVNSNSTSESPPASTAPVPSSNSSSSPPPIKQGAPSDPPTKLKTSEPQELTVDGRDAKLQPWRRANSRYRYKRQSPNQTDPSSGKGGAQHIAFDARPGFLVANIGNGCMTPNGNAEVKYPNPGPDVVQGDGEYPLKLPTPEDKCRG
ncbi:hypothetical protein PRK78_000039 [Emydomyces testavorans]|uniref:Lytic polysaccharide monooxygenase n=1 Tax=Emydomyces testavorans TaxID=2070801 RepID=A0AAF0DAP8_9EURO|nr:hypothetical protein PRK78_000039 [Emydomyces testavorans]